MTGNRTKFPSLEMSGKRCIKPPEYMSFFALEWLVYPIQSQKVQLCEQNGSSIQLEWDNCVSLCLLFTPPTSPYWPFLPSFSTDAYGRMYNYTRRRDVLEVQGDCVTVITRNIWKWASVNSACGLAFFGYLAQLGKSNYSWSSHILNLFYPNARFIRNKWAGYVMFTWFTTCVSSTRWQQ